MGTSIYDRLRDGVITASADETQRLAEELARALPAESTLALHGDLGVGKTTFVQGLAHGFGIRDAVTSPTFNIFTVHRGRTNLVHLDAYRLNSGADLENLLLADFLMPPWCLAVEWPEKVADWLPDDTLHFQLRIAPDQRHTIRLG